MVIARLSKWSFKEGKRNDVFSELDLTFGVAAREAKGYRGSLSLLSKDDPSVGLVITLWTDEESFKASETDVLKSAMQKFMSSLKESPVVEKYTVFTAELKELTPS